MPIIISASRSTDVPAFYSDWFIEPLLRRFQHGSEPLGSTSRNSPVRYERVQPAPREGVWSMEIFKPEVGAYEDHTITVRGVPGWLFVSEGRYWK